MPTPIPTDFTLGAVAPEEAMAAFQARGLLETTFSWQDLWHVEHTRAFTISRLAETDLLDFVRAELDKAIEAGTDFRDWADTIQQRFEAAGWWGKRQVVDTATGEKVSTTFDPKRLQLIFEVNTRQSYAAGRWAGIERSKARLPFVIYRTMRDEQVRNSHRPWDGLALPVDDPWWDTHYPPCGWRCRCHAYAIDQRGLDKLRAAGLPVKTEAPPTEWVEFTNKRTGEVSKVPRGVDPGFGYNPRAPRPVLRG
ncbi:putative head morphogenesis protein SPP1 gp7 [Leptothrix cholodnii SP-6]|uniref:Putative head morphogenesis protein SPP1 gp7 n=1 Tax=Leptothrix cholodnii (strain ATCC 51168 / LMG 8142 / SP-6) TaxID=395495 RepID=B1Y3I5_LEPCP|nr:phage minor head protein [Leptothrix cholodnii]ACB34513.1 putative head morphogenesis protein SPP1 gp7 [Leptothrix cholodnii SP-6]